MNERTNRSDLWYLSLIPLGAAILFFAGWLKGVVISAQVPLALAAAVTRMPWIMNTPGTAHDNGLALLVVALGTIAGALLFTFVALLVVEAKRQIVALYRAYQLGRRGAVSGVIRPRPRSVWSSHHSLIFEPRPYRTRLGLWVRREYERRDTSDVFIER